MQLVLLIMLAVLGDAGVLSHKNTAGAAGMLPAVSCIAA